MSRCPHCGARGVKLEDYVHLQELTIRTDYCGRCGRSWPKQLIDTVAADGQPPTDDMPLPAPRDVEPRPAVFGAKVAQIAERLKGGRDWKHAQAGDEA